MMMMMMMILMMMQIMMMIEDDDDDDGAFKEYENYDDEAVADNDDGIDKLSIWKPLL